MSVKRLAAAVLLAALANAQAPAPAGDLVHPDKRRVVEEVLRKRDDMREGKVRRFNVRVRVRLNNGAKLNGVVKGGRFVEREEGLDFVEADRKTPEAGIRLYYFDDTTSFIFLHWRDIDTHKVVVTLTDAEVRAIEAELVDKEQKRVAERQAAAAANAAKGPGEPGADDKPIDGTKKPTGQPKTQEGQGAKAGAALLSPLLDEFPPAEGWGDAKLKEIERRKIAVGVYPNEKEKRFISVYEAWQKELAAREEAAPAPAANTGTASTATPKTASPNSASSSAGASKPAAAAPSKGGRAK